MGQRCEISLKNEEELIGIVDDVQEAESTSDGRHEGRGAGGHTEDGVLTIPCVISQLSMGSS